MNLRQTALPGVYVLEPSVHEDSRGRFTTHFARDWFRQHNLVDQFDQIATSHNPVTGTLRGMHWQDEPHPQTKLVRCSRGAVHDVVLDLRSYSPGFGQWIAVELSEENELTLYVPAGCAHGFQTLRHDSLVTYLINGTYSPVVSRGVRWDDPRFGIRWPPCERRVISDCDAGFTDYP